MATYIKGNTIHSALHIDINRSKLMPMSHSELITLRSKDNSLKAIFYEEVSAIGKRVFNRSKQRLQQIMEIKKPSGGQHVIDPGDFYQMASRCLYFQR